MGAALFAQHGQARTGLVHPHQGDEIGLGGPLFRSLPAVSLGVGDVEEVVLRDRRALAACLRGSRRLMTSEEAAGITVPVLIAVGTRDEIAGSAQALGQVIPGAEVLDIPNRDHMRAVGDKVYKTGVTDFLSRRQ